MALVLGLSAFALAFTNIPPGGVPGVYSCDPRVDIDKYANATQALVGDVVHYTFNVSNIGNVPLNVSVTDNKFGFIGTWLNIPVGGFHVFTFDWTANAVEDPLTNNATVQGRYDGYANVTDWDTWTVDILFPCIEIDKSANVTFAAMGDAVRYSYNVTNCGDVPLNVTVTDDMLGLIGTITNLPPHTFQVLYKDWVVTPIPDASNNLLPENVTMKVFQPGSGSYFNVILSGGTPIDGTYNGWCVDIDHTIATNTSYNALVFSSLEPLPAGLVEHPENFDLVNWILNQHFVGKSSPGGFGIYTYGDVQRAIWALIEDGQSTSGLGSWNQNRVDEILAAAHANGEGYVPGCDDIFGVVLAPTNTNIQVIITQVTLVEAGIPCDETGPFCNNATATGEYHGTFVYDWDEYCIPLATPCLELFKTVTSTGPYRVGDTVTYNVTLWNCGDVALDTVLNDALLGNVSVPVHIEAGETITWIVDRVIQESDQSPLCNVVTVNATYGSAVFNLEASACVDIVRPCFYIEKSVDKPTALVGEKVVFNITLVNCGDIDLNVNMTDALLGNETVVSIDAGQTMTWLVEYTIPEGTYALGATCDIENTVYANATFGSWYDEDSASACVDVLTPCIDVLKSVNVTTAVIGDWVRFNVTVVNCGDVVLSIGVQDYLLGIDEYVLVPAGQKQEYLIDYQIPQAAYVLGAPCDVPNVVDINATYGNWFSTDSADACVDVKNPCMYVEKSVNKPTALVGNKVIFNVTLVNCGDVDLDVNMSDILLGNETVVSIAAGQTMTWLIEYTIPAGTYALGAVCDIENIVQINATYGNWFDHNYASACVDVENPCLQLFKTITSTGPYRAGDTITYNVTLVNCGDVNLDTVLNDPLLENDSVQVHIEAGETITWIIDYVVQESDISPLCNMVTVNATYGSADFDLQAEVCTDLQRQPCIDIDKYVSEGPYLIGTNVTYYFNVTNCGDVELTDVSVYDDMLDQTIPVGTLSPGQWVVVESWHVILWSDQDPLCNNATATGYFFQVEVSDWDYLCVDFEQQPCIEIDKYANVTEAQIGDWVRYFYNVTNCGDVPLNVTVTDDRLGLIGTIENLMPGTWQVLFKDMLVTGSGTVDPFTLPDIVTMSVVYQSAGAPSYFLVTVTGGTTLDGVYNGWCADLDLDITGGVVYPALVYSSLGPLPPGMIDNASNIDLINWILNMEFVGKPSPSGGVYMQKDVQTAIWFLIENIMVPGSGNPARVNEIIAAARAGGEGYVPGCNDTFAVFLRPVNPATNRTVAQIVIIEAEITCEEPGPLCNNATATGEYHGTFVYDWDEYCLNTPENPCLELFKTVTSTGPYRVGDTVTYNVTLWNCGDVALDTVLNDALLGNVSVPVHIEAGETITWIVDRVIQESDQSPLCNVVTVNATYGSAVFNLEASACVDILEPGAPCIDIDKWFSNGPYLIGTNVTYYFNVTNCGDVELTDVSVYDDMLDQTIPVGTLSPGQWVVVEAWHILLASDPDPLCNNATATGHYDQVTVQDWDRECLNIDFAPVLLVEKSANDTAVFVGDWVKYTITVQHDPTSDCSNVTIASVLDSLGTLAYIGGDTHDDGVLECGEVWAFELDRQALASDPDRLCNTANATGMDRDGAEVFDSDDECVEITKLPCIGIEKSANATDVAIGDVVRYSYNVTNCGDVPLNVTVMDDMLGLIGTITNLPPHTFQVLYKDWVVTGSGTVDPFTLPEMVTVSVVFQSAGAPSYFLVTVTGGTTLDGVYNGWCADLDFDITGGVLYPALVYSSLGPLPAGMIEHPENIDLINWILNMEFVGKPSPSGGVYMQKDVQTAIWFLIENIMVPGSGNPTRVGEILAAANAGGEGYVPGCNDTFAVFLRPVNPATNRTVAQIVIIEAEITCEEPGPICNNATATGEYDGMVVQDWDRYCLNIGNPCIQLFKSISDTSLPGPYHIGDTVIFNVTVWNCGDVPLEVDFMDELLGNATSFTLAPGEVSTWLPEFIIPEDDYEVGKTCDITNTAAVNASYSTWTANLTASVCVEVELPEEEPSPCLEIYKSVEPTEALIGDTVYFNVTLVNCGNVNLEVDFLDQFFGNDTVVQIAAGQTLEWILPYEVLETDWVDGSDCDIYNIVIVNATYGSWEFDGSADACVDVVKSCIQIEKWVAPEHAIVGGDVTYYYNVTNCGDVELTGVVVYDNVTMETLDVGDNTLAPGEWVLVEFNYTIPEAATNPLCNNATATGYYGLVAVEDWDTACVSLDFPTRTLGFWKNHTNDTLATFALLGGNFTIGCGSCAKVIDSPEALFAALFASNPFESNGTGRDDYEQARIMLAKQLIPAILNVAKFGSYGTATDLIALANGTYCNLNATVVMTYHDALTDFNEGGDLVAVPGFPTGSATPDDSQAYADDGMWYWDDTCSSDPRP